MPVTMCSTVKSAVCQYKSSAAAAISSRSPAPSSGKSNSSQNTGSAAIALSVFLDPEIEVRLQALGRRAHPRKRHQHHRQMIGRAFGVERESIVLVQQAIESSSLHRVSAPGAAR